MEDLPGEFTLTDQHGARHPLRRYPPSHAERTLGVYISMDGNQLAEIRYLKEKCTTFGAKLRSSSCTMNEAIYTFESWLLPALRYAMPVTTISYKDWNDILAPALIPCLQKAGISKNAPRAVLFGPKSLHGFGLSHPYFQQQICHVETLLQQVLSCTQTGTILRASAEQF